MTGSGRWLAWLKRWNGALQIACGLGYLGLSLTNDFRNPTLAVVLGVLFVVVGTGSLITRVRADRRRQRDQFTASDPARRGVEL